MYNQHMMTGIVYIWNNFYYKQSVQYNVIDVFPIVPF